MTAHNAELEANPDAATGLAAADLDVGGARQVDARRDVPNEHPRAVPIRKRPRKVDACVDALPPPRICFPDGHIFKIIGDAGPGGGNTPGFDDNNFVDRSLYVPAIDPSKP